MRRGTRALVELTSWLTQHLWEFFAIVPAGQEFGERLAELNGRDVDPSFVWADIYTLRFLPDVLKSEPRGILPPGYKPSGLGTARRIHVRDVVAPSPQRRARRRWAEPTGVGLR